MLTVAITRLKLIEEHYSKYSSLCQRKQSALECLIRVLKFWPRSDEQHFQNHLCGFSTMGSQKVPFFPNAQSQKEIEMFENNTNNTTLPLLPPKSHQILL